MEKDILKKKSAGLRSILMAVTLGLGAVWSSEGTAADLTALKVAYPSLSGTQTAFWVGVEAKIFEKNGLAVEPVFLEGGTKTVLGIISGDVPLANVGGAPVVVGNLGGGDVVMVAGNETVLSQELVVSKGVTDPEGLRGGKVAVSRFGSASDFAARYALQRLGLTPDKDVAIVQMGSIPTRFAALQSGTIHGAMITPPETVQARKQGYRTLLDLSGENLEIQGNGVTTSRAFIRSKPEVVRQFVKGYVEAIHYAKTHPEETIQAMAKYLKTTDREILEETYRHYVLKVYPRKPYPSLKGIQFILNEEGEKNPKAKAATPEQFVDLRFLQELDDSGHIDRLYR